MVPDLPVSRNLINLQGSCWVRRRFHVGSASWQFTKPCDFTGFLLGSTLVPCWFQISPSHETLCIYRVPAWFCLGSTLVPHVPTSRPPVILQGSCLVPHWFHVGSRSSHPTKPDGFTGILLGSALVPRGFRTFAPRHGWTQLEKLVHLGPGTNPGTDSEWMLTDPGASEISEPPRRADSPGSCAPASARRMFSFARSGDVPPPQVVGNVVTRGFRRPG